MLKFHQLPVDFVRTFSRHIKFVKVIGIDIFDDSNGHFLRNFWKLIIAYIALVSTVFGQYLYIFLSHKTNANLLDVINAIPGTLMATQDIVKLCIITVKRNEIRKVILEIAELWPDNTDDTQKVKTLDSWTRRLQLFERFFYYCGYVAISLFLLVPMLTTIYTYVAESKTVYQFPLDTYYFTFLKSHYAYAFAYTYTAAEKMHNMPYIPNKNTFIRWYFFLPLVLYFALLLACTFHMCVYIAIDFILTSLIFDVSGLLAALKKDFDNIEPLQDSELQNDDCSFIKGIVQRHQKLLSVVDNLNTIFGPLLFTQVTFSSIIICCFGFLTVVGKDLIKSLLATLGVILAMFNFCWSGQLLSDTSSGLADAAYNCAWYSRSIKFRKYIQIIIIRAQKPCLLSALGFSDVTLTTLSKILSTSWSYLSLLNQMYQDIDIT